jgi:hypothetical protein
VSWGFFCLFSKIIKFRPDRGGEDVDIGVVDAP